MREVHQTDILVVATINVVSYIDNVSGVGVEMVKEKTLKILGQCWIYVVMEKFEADTKKNGYGRII